jgi:hypothetical protein
MSDKIKDNETSFWSRNTPRLVFRASLVVAAIYYAASSVDFGSNQPASDADTIVVPAIVNVTIPPNRIIKQNKTQLVFQRDFSNFAFVSLLTGGGSYAHGAVILGYSIQTNSGYFTETDKPPQMIMMYTENSLDEYELCLLRRAGWDPKAVPVIEPFTHNGAPQDRYCMLMKVPSHVHQTVGLEYD